MLFKGSFYENTPLFDAEDDESVFDGLRPRALDRPEPILEHSVALKERLDGVAHHYYADGRAWRRIAEANPEALFPEDLLFDPVPTEDGGAHATEGRERLGNVILIPRRKDGSR